jgi:photosystem II stability/assembly factor-like uncharacterized protein
LVHTSDDGAHWTVARVSGAEALDFRDVHAVDDRVGYVLSSGPGALSRIYKTADGGASWTLQLTNPDTAGFLDALAFFDPTHGLVCGDPVDGRFQVFRTEDGGTTWVRNRPEGMPPALPGEGAFAASGTCLVVHGDRRGWLATGGARVSRVFRTEDSGRTWSVAENPISAGNDSSGIFSLTFADAEHGFAAGGDYKRPDQVGQGLSFSRTLDGGRTWSSVEGAPNAFRSGLATVAGPSGSVFIAVGPGGADVSLDGGRSWRAIGKEGFHAVAAAGTESVWAVGDNGRIARLKGIAAGR